MHERCGWPAARVQARGRVDGARGGRRGIRGIKEPTNHRSSLRQGDAIISELRRSMATCGRGRWSLKPSESDHPETRSGACFLQTRMSSSQMARRWGRRALAEPAVNGRRDGRGYQREFEKTWRWQQASRRWHEILEGEILEAGRKLQGFLFLLQFRGGDGFAHAAGVLAIESLAGSFKQAVLGRVFHQHLRPCHALEHTPMTSGEVEEGSENENDAEDAHAVGTTGSPWIWQAGNSRIVRNTRASRRYDIKEPRSCGRISRRGWLWVSGWFPCAGRTGGRRDGGCGRWLLRGRR